MGVIMSSEQPEIRFEKLAEGRKLTKEKLITLAGEFGIELETAKAKGVKKADIVREILKKIPQEKMGELIKRAEEIIGEKAERGKRATSAGIQRDLLREISEIRRIIDERLPARVPSFRDFTKTLIDEYWRLGGSFVNYEKLRDAVCARMSISLQQFDVWFNDLVWASAGRLTVGESRTSEGRSVHVLMKAKTPEELVWGS